MRWLALLVIAGCGNDVAAPARDAPVPIDVDPRIDAAPAREVMHLVQPLQAGEIVEAQMVGGPADRMVVRLEAPAAAVDFNIHSHPGGTTLVVHEEFKIMVADYDFTPTTQTDWFLLVRNSGATNMDVKMTISLYGAMTFAFL